MTITEFKNKKEELEKTVLKLLQDFEKETNFRVGSVIDWERDYKKDNKPLLFISLTASM